MSFTEVILILVIALVILGPERLPGLAKSLGRAMREFRKASREIRATLEVEEVRRTIRQRAEQELKGTEQPPEVERTGRGSVAWKDGADDLAEKKQTLEDARKGQDDARPTPSVEGRDAESDASTAQSPETETPNSEGAEGAKSSEKSSSKGT